MFLMAQMPGSVNQVLSPVVYKYWLFLLCGDGRYQRELCAVDNGFTCISYFMKVRSVVNHSVIRLGLTFWPV